MHDSVATMLDMGNTQHYANRAEPTVIAHTTEAADGYSEQHQIGR